MDITKCEKSTSRFDIQVLFCRDTIIPC